MRRFIRLFGSNVLTIKDGNLWCILCSCPVTAEKKYFVFQHMKTASHQANADLRDIITPVKVYDENRMKEQKEFLMDLCKMLIDAGIPLDRLENESLRFFLRKYSYKSIPEDHIFKMKFLDISYDTTIKHIRDEVSDEMIWVSFEEMIDINER